MSEIPYNIYFGMPNFKFKKIEDKKIIKDALDNFIKNEGEDNI
tara:strand:- start:903 stop:1031 length:129 start_codon:yes stop_codon:yes gene_type:complete